MMWIFKLTEASMKPHYSIGDTMTQLITTLGPKSSAELGMILPHEHVFVDLRTWDQPGYGQGEAEDVIHLMAPEISKVKEIGVTAMVECSTVGVGRRADIDRAVSFLVRKYGCCSLGVALERQELCARADDLHSAREWSVVAARLRTLLMGASGSLH